MILVNTTVLFVNSLFIGSGFPGLVNYNPSSICISLLEGVTSQKNYLFFFSYTAALYLVFRLNCFYRGFSIAAWYMEKKKYNLWSAKSEGTQVPVQLQLSSDNNFITNLLGSDTLSMAQQESQNSSFKSDLDGSAVINGSDSDDTSTSGRSFNRHEPEMSSKPTQSADSNGIQALVKQQILAQHCAISDRLTKLEHSKQMINKK